MSSYKVIVAKYNEDVNWLSKVNIEHFIIYDKGTSAIPSCVPKNQVIKRRNLGREVESFIYYIITNYDNLPDYVIFLQGKPFDHLTREINQDTIQQKIDEIVAKEPPHTFPFYTHVSNTSMGLYSEKLSEFPGLNVNASLNFILGIDEPREEINFAPSCQYIVPRGDILKKPIEFYKNLNAMLRNGEPDYFVEHDTVKQFCPFRLSGWAFERLMYEVFLSQDYNKDMKLRRYLVTGGAGFIGSNLVERLLEQGHLVVVIDNLSTGSEDNLRAAREKYPKRLHFIKGDIKDESTLFLAGCVDGIFHMAAMSKVLPSLENLDMVDFCNDENVKGTISVLKYAATAGPAPIKVVYSASSTYYGNQPIPHCETMLPQCQTPYSSSKYCGEIYCEMFSILHKVPTVRLRYFMVYGEREPSAGQYAVVTGIFRKNCEEGRALEIHGDGSQTRDFVYVGDVCEACIRAMEKEDLINETINVGTGKMISIKEIADMISPNQIFIPSPRKVDLRATLADTEKIERLFGWKPSANIKDYLLRRAF